MTVEVLIVAMVLSFGLAWLAMLIGKRSLRAKIVTCISVSAVGICWVLNAAVEHPLPERDVTNRPIRDPVDGHLGSTSCRSCHADHHKTWHNSYHRTMTQVVSPASMRGDFSEQKLTIDGQQYVFERQGDEFWAEFEDPDHNLAQGPAPRIKRQLIMSTGSHHMQVYWYSVGVRRELGQFPLIYLFEAQRWIPRGHAFMMQYESHPKSERNRWATSCIVCHATHGRPRLDWKDTRASEFGIACESCHGPGEEHVCSNSSPTRRYALHWQQGSDDTIVNPLKLSRKRSSQVCGNCHGLTKPFLRVKSSETASAVFSRLMKETEKSGELYRAGDDLYETRFLTRIFDYSQLGDIPDGDYRKEYTKLLDGYHESRPDVSASKFWPDGMLRVSGREFNGLVETPCYQRGEMTCLSCHQMHQQADDPRHHEEWANDQLKVRADTNQACLQCHDKFSNDETLAEHTHHAADSTGSLCYNCHMPYTTYGLLKTIRSHTIDSPRVDVELKSGRTNACNLCHLDQTLAWTGQHLSDWYSQPATEVPSDHQMVPDSIITALSGDAGQRAVVACALGWKPAQTVSGTEWIARVVSVLLDDDYPAVRYIAGRTLKSLPGFDDYDYDFVPQPKANRCRAEAALERWRQQRQSDGEPPNLTELLDQTEGPVSDTILDELFKRRDNKAVFLAE
ncbi:MAG: hypothetical protein MK102_15540 [Fuerstiella sp.]|nr:hypothetical protein [Fuerstiella sp.]